MRHFSDIEKAVTSLPSATEKYITEMIFELAHLALQDGNEELATLLQDVWRKTTEKRIPVPV